MWNPSFVINEMSISLRDTVVASVVSFSRLFLSVTLLVAHTHPAWPSLIDSNVLTQLRLMCSARHAQLMINWFDWRGHEDMRDQVEWEHSHVIASRDRCDQDYFELTLSMTHTVDRCEWFGQSNWSGQHTDTTHTRKSRTTIDTTMVGSYGKWKKGDRNNDNYMSVEKEKRRRQL